MRIAIDARAWDWEGIGRYTRNLLRALLQRDDGLEYVGLVSAQDRKAAENMSASLNEVARRKIRWQEVNGSYYSWREQLYLGRELAKIPADLFHFTHFNVPLGFRKPFVVTIHDVTRFYFPGQNRQKLLQQIAYEWVFKRAVERAQGIISVSESTKSSLAGLGLKLPVLQAVIYEGIDPSFLGEVDRLTRQKVRMMLGGSFPYVLFVGVWMSQKNLVRLVEAVAQVRKEFPNVKLVITGRPKPGYGSVLKTIQKALGADEVVLPGFVSAELLPALYAEAACFAFPSLYEGFGLPILEAAAAGTPVVTSNVTSMPELLGDYAEYVNPESINDMARGIARVLRSGEDVKTRTMRAREIINQFSWDKAAEEHVRMYTQAL